MKTRLWFLALVGFLLFCGGSTWAEDDFYVITAGGASPGTKITSLPYPINNPGFYYLSGNLVYNGTGNAISVTNNDVTIDLMGFSLANAGSVGSTVGIFINCDNVTVRNGTLRGFYEGIYSNGSNHRVINVRATGNNYGVFLYGNNHLIKNSNGSNNTTTGLGIGGPGMIMDCVASNNLIGIRFYGPGNLIGNTAVNNSNRNFALGNGVATNIMADRNSADGLNPNYFIVDLTTGVVGLDAGTKTNAGLP